MLAAQPTLQKQRDALRVGVRRYRHHPALLVWGLGNEREFHGTRAGTPDCSTNWKLQCKRCQHLWARTDDPRLWRELVSPRPQQNPFRSLTTPEPPSNRLR